VVIPTSDGRELLLRRRTEPDHDWACLENVDTNSGGFDVV